MALRVLLADESVTIKKAFQLALQDYAVDIVSVNAGVDVIPVAMKFKPDLIFADVLLQKKNAYELCTELKSLDETKEIPVVLIWSGFMELDKDKFHKCKANAELEKPFDTERLRTLVQSLVPRLADQKLGEHLEFPKLPDFEEQPPADLPEMTQTAVNNPIASSTEPSITPPVPTEADQQQKEVSNPEWTMSQFENITSLANETDEFSEVPLKQNPDSQAIANDTQSTAFELEDKDHESNETSWVSKTLTEFKIDKDNLHKPDEVDYVVPEDHIDSDTLIRNRDTVTSHWSDVENQQTETVAVDETLETDDDTEVLAEAPNLAAAGSIGISEERIEEIIRAQAKEVLEKVIWDVVPEIATQVIEREIQKLMNESSDEDLES